MPIRHVIDPKMPQLPSASLGAVFSLAMTGWGTYGLSVALAMAKDAFVKDNSRPTVKDGYSASQFQGCSRKVILSDTVDYDESITDLFWRVKGTLIHAAIEEALAVIPAEFRAHFHSEQRLSATIDDIPISGRYDLYYDGGHPEWHIPILWDHKTTRLCPREPKAEHIAQTNVYAWLLSQNGKPKPEVIEINYIDGERAEAFRFEPWGDATVEAYLHRRLIDGGLGAAYHSGVLPKRVDEEGRWQCGQNRTNTRYCPFTDRCWPDGIGTVRDGFASEAQQEGNAPTAAGEALP